MPTYIAPIADDDASQAAGRSFMTKIPISLAAAAAVVITLASSAHAVATPTPAPEPNPAVPTLKVQEPSGTTITDPGVIRVADLPLAKTAQFKRIFGHAYTAKVLHGISACSPNGVPDAGRLDPRVTAGSKAYIAPLTASGDTRGWAAFLSVSTYPSTAAASSALQAYRAYLENCPAADPKELSRSGGAGASSHDPTTTHTSIATKDHWIEAFAVSTSRGVVEVVYTKPKGTPAAFGADPRSTFAALKAVDIATFLENITTDPLPSGITSEK
ncbi:hypothetical protein GCM10009551_054390 [Nocardiopsis tropica]|uniref:hypothetical protein n=1 Tax=Tsukamurella strandjordii TaxID=147577 RepID=UPI0031D63819